MATKRITARKYQGDDAASWAVFVDGRPVVTGLGRNEVPYYKRLAEEQLAKADHAHYSIDGRTCDTCGKAV